MTPALRAYLLTDHIVGSFVVNAVLNGLIAWLSFRSVDLVPMWGPQSIGGDIIGTTIVLPLLTTLIVTRIVRSHLRSDRIVSPGWTGSLGTLLRRFPDATFRRGLAFAAVTTALVAPPTIVALVAFGIMSLELSSFVIFKTVFGGLLGAIVQPFVAMWAIMDGNGGEAPIAAAVPQKSE